MKLTRTGQVVAAVTIAGAVGLLIFLLNPVCFFHTLTGWNCPGCGTTRALQQLAQGNLLAALRCNPLTILAIPLAALWLIAPNRRARQPLWIWLGLAVVVAFGVARNIPGPLSTSLNP